MTIFDIWRGDTHRRVLRAPCPSTSSASASELEPSGELVALPLSRVHPAYRGMTDAEMRAAMRSTLLELTVEQVAELTWTIEDYARSARSASAAR